jgi:hypothetical protein
MRVFGILMTDKSPSRTHDEALTAFVTRSMLCNSIGSCSWRHFPPQGQCWISYLSELSLYETIFDIATDCDMEQYSDVAVSMSLG